MSCFDIRILRIVISVFSLAVVPVSHAYDMMGGQIYAEDPYVGILNLNPDFGQESETAGIGFHIDGDTINGKIWSQNFGWIDLQPSGGGLRLNATSDLAASGYSGSGSGAGISGKAWGQEIGWLEFGKEGNNQGVWVDSDGYLHGAAWSRQVGYLLFGESMNHLTSKTGADDQALYWARTAWRPSIVATLSPVLDLLPAYTGGSEIAVNWEPLEGTQSKIEISTTATFEDGTVISSGWLAEGTEDYTFSNLDDTQTYYIRVQSKDDDGTLSDYSEVSSTTMDNTPPSVGTVSSVDGEVSADLEITFSWDGFTDDGDVMAYNLQISTSPNFESGTIIREYTSYDGTTQSFQGEVGVSYYARVSAIDAVGNTSDYIVIPAPVQANVTGGVILDENNVPIVGATLTFVDENGEVYTAITDAEGVYAINLPEEHTYTLTISDGIHEDYETQFSLNTGSDAEKIVLSVSLEEAAPQSQPVVPETTTYQETIVDTEGNPIAGLLVQVIDKNGEIQYIQTNENGTFSVELTQGENYVIKIDNPLVENYQANIVAGQATPGNIEISTVFSADSIGGSSSQEVISQYFEEGASPASFTELSQQDSDNDGISDVIEIQASESGDLNSDNQKDLLQSNTASLINENTQNYNVLQTNQFGQCQNFSDVDSEKIDSLEYPLGSWKFTLQCTTPGASQAVKIFLDKIYDTSQWKVIKNINGGIRDITNRTTIGQEQISGKTVSVIIYTLTDGGDLDADGQVNSVILDPISILIQEDSPSNTGQEDTSASEPATTNTAPQAQLAPASNPKKVSDSGGNAKSMVFRYAGQTREEANKLLSLGGEGLSKAEFADAYKKSLEEALARNEGIDATKKTVIDRYGNERFAGYIKGKLSTDEFKRADNKVVYRGTNVTELEQEVYLLAAEEAKYPQYFWVAESADVELLSPFSESVFFVQSHGLLGGDNERNFGPEQSVTWEDILSVQLWAKEKELISQKEMHFVPRLEGIPKDKSRESRVIYTARKYNFIPEDFSPNEILTREKLIKRLFHTFSLKTNGRSVRSNFSDVPYSSTLFPFIATVHREGWFDQWDKEESSKNYLFKPDQVLERKQFAFWVNKAIEKANKQKVETLQKRFADIKSGALKKKYNKDSVKASARVGLSQLISANDAVDSHMRNRDYKKNKPQYFGPTRAAWNPVNKDTKRKQMWFKDNTANIRRGQRVNVVRRLDVVPDELLVKQAEKLVKYEPAAVAKIRKMPRVLLEKEVQRLLQSKVGSNIQSSSNNKNIRGSRSRNIKEIDTVDDIEKASRKNLEEKLLELMKREQIMENQARLRQQQAASKNKNQN